MPLNATKENDIKNKCWQKMWHEYFRFHLFLCLFSFVLNRLFIIIFFIFLKNSINLSIYLCILQKKKKLNIN